MPHGPKGTVGFDPKIQQEDFKAAFVGAEGWGTYTQKVTHEKTEYSLKIAHGTLKLRQFELPALSKDKVRYLLVTLNNRKVKVPTEVSGEVIHLKFVEEIELKQGDLMNISIK